MGQYLLILALIFPDTGLNRLVKIKSLTPPIAMEDCIRLQQNKIIQSSYNIDLKLKTSGQPILLCVEYKQ